MRGYIQRKAFQCPVDKAYYAMIQTFDAKGNLISFQTAKINGNIEKHDNKLVGGTAIMSTTADEKHMILSKVAALYAKEDAGSQSQAEEKDIYVIFKLHNPAAHANAGGQPFAADCAYCVHLGKGKAFEELNHCKNAHAGQPLLAFSGKCNACVAHSKEQTTGAKPKLPSPAGTGDTAGRSFPARKGSLAPSNLSYVGKSDALGLHSPTCKPDDDGVRSSPDCNACNACNAHARQKRTASTSSIHSPSCKAEIGGYPSRRCSACASLANTKQSGNASDTQSTTSKTMSDSDSSTGNSSGSNTTSGLSSGNSKPKQKSQSADHFAASDSDASTTSSFRFRAGISKPKPPKKRHLFKIHDPLCKSTKNGARFNPRCNACNALCSLEKQKEAAAAGARI